jgi:hypothetical protein
VASGQPHINLVLASLAVDLIPEILRARRVEVLAAAIGDLIRIQELGRKVEPFVLAPSPSAGLHGGPACP